jgi:hypothetical protein
MNIKANQICKTPETTGYSHANQSGMLHSSSVNCVRYAQLPWTPSCGVILSESDVISLTRTELGKQCWVELTRRRHNACPAA